MTLAVVSATVPDLLRLVAVPVFAWAAVRDVRIRRVPSAVWIPLGVLGAALLVWDGWTAWHAGGVVWSREFLLPAAVSLGFVAPLAYLFWWIGGFGGADAKALLVLALLYPTYPVYVVAGYSFPLTATPVGSFAFTILTNAVVVALAIPVSLAIRNAAAGRVGPITFVGRPIAAERLPEVHGRLLASPDGRARGGLDLDALRMYLRWRGLTLADVRDEPARYRDPASLPDEPNPPTDGIVTATHSTDGGDADEPDDDGSTTVEDWPHTPRDGSRPIDDPWGAKAFLEDIEGSAYGTTPAELRAGLEAVAEADRVWVSPGIPFLVPVFVGFVIALVYGDLLVGLVF
ncbi:A24 family peptidase C-terminal domain-containing protein [Natrialbaceae archaeon AArc-T1-2]|uniref:A24 family peptidase C-terminal domain-containing protein n=1 Tax=Natrialbaceae archaeon AArc-T1-2 TaxID=3053904 RepID=UPI00255A96C0|nr:A24 family peptidase C-terminal domain-containing protein [Natrialbaceae archaeon AArc-T1-2]WIV66040.1 A24 family peptidase C-terminal domain-containing protein [Natrialbaceae archaeon AArc-T1-2]